MLKAMAEACRERGAAPVTVADVAARSRVSRRTFYEMFEGKEDCFLATLDEAIARAAAVVLPAYSAQPRWVDAIRAGLAAFLRFLDENRTFGGLMIVEVLGAGKAALRRRAETMDAVVAAIDGGRRQARSQEGLTQMTAEGVLGAVLGVLHSRLTAEQLAANGASAQEPMVCLLGKLMSIVVLPYLGPAAARRELARPSPTSTARRSRAQRRDPLSDVGLRLTYRTIRVLQAIALRPGSSNRQVAELADLSDQGQTSKLLSRLAGKGLIRNGLKSGLAGEPNAWRLTPLGVEVVEEIGRKMR